MRRGGMLIESTRSAGNAGSTPGVRRSKGRNASGVVQAGNLTIMAAAPQP